MTELFYDLVYVYTISQLTSIIHHAHHGVVSPQSFFNFSVGLIVFVNSWMVQTVFTNRFGNNSLKNIIFMFLQMICLLVSSRAVAGDWQNNFVWIFLPMALISLLLLMQYISEYFQTSNDVGRSLMEQFFYILGLRSFILFLNSFKNNIILQINHNFIQKRKEITKFSEYLLKNYGIILKTLFRKR